MSIPNSYNPSDYEYLLRSLTEGSQVAKAEALKRFQILAGSDRKQFTVYAKRIILAIQDLVAEPKVLPAYSVIDKLACIDVSTVNSKCQP